MQPPTPTNVTPPKQKSTGGKKFLTILSWVFAVILLLAGLGAFASKEILPGLFTLFLGLLFLPPLSKPLHFGKIVRIIGVVLWFVLIGITAKGTSTTTFEERSLISLITSISTQEFHISKECSRIGKGLSLSLINKSIGSKFGFCNSSISTIYS